LHSTYTKLQKLEMFPATESAQTATAERFRPNPDALGASVHATLESKSLALQREIEPGRARSPAIQRCLELQTARGELWIFKPYPGLLTKTAGIYGCSSPHISPFGIPIAVHRRGGITGHLRIIGGSL
jgi:hypothetical protein